MTEVLQEPETISLGKKLRAKIRHARWSLLLWAVFAVALTLASLWLFPGAHFRIDGGLQGILLVLAVDLVLGPMLFILVANPEKSLRERRLDAIALFSVQLLAMSWGSWQVYSQRPVAISYMPDGFAVSLIMSNFSRQDLSPDALPASRLGRLPAFYVSLPTGTKAIEDLGLLLQSDVPLAAQKALLHPLFSNEQQVFITSTRFQSYWKGEGSGLWQEWSRHHGSKPTTDYRFIAFIGRYGVAALVLDQENRLAGYIRLPGEQLPTALRGS